MRQDGREMCQFSTPAKPHRQKTARLTPAVYQPRLARVTASSTRPAAISSGAVSVLISYFVVPYPRTSGTSRHGPCPLTSAATRPHASG